MSIEFRVPFSGDNGILDRIGLIGPVLPYRGGIAQYTTMLHRAMRNCCEVVTVSLKRGYPKCVYPGRSCREPGYEDHLEEDVDYILDPLSPHSWPGACRVFEERRVTRVVVSWWAVVWWPCLMYMVWRLSRRGVGVIFLCHNVFDHEGSSWKDLLSRIILSRRQFFMVHSRSDAAMLKKLAPDADIRIHDHPVCTHFPAPLTSLPKRGQLELLFFGFVRPYKGVDILAEAMEILKGDDLFLTIAGEWWMSDPDLKSRLAASERIEVVDRYLSEDEVGRYFSRCDVVVLPYRKASGSGVVSLASHFGKPVIASGTGGLIDAVEGGVPGILFKPSDPVALADSIRSFLCGKTNREEVAGNAEPRNWESLARAILEIPCRIAI